MAEGEDRPTFESLVDELRGIGQDVFGLALAGSDNGYLDVAQEKEESFGFFGTLFRYELLVIAAQTLCDAMAM
jgi:hypothetical protein